MSLRDKFEAAIRDATGDGSNSAAAMKHLLKMIDEEETTRPLRVGDHAPDFVLTTSDGNAISSEDALSIGALVLTFYRGLWCPFCRADLEKIKEVFSEISEASASVIAITHPTVPGTQSARAPDLNLPFSILEDHDGETAVAYGVRWSPDDLKLIEELNGFNVGLLQGTEPWIVPMQARFVIGRDKKIIFSEVAFNYDQCADPKELVSLLGKS